MSAFYMPDAVKTSP